MREKARQRKAEKFMISVFRSTEERTGFPVVLFHAYADAIHRYHLEGWRPAEDRHNLGETNAEGRARYERLTEAMAAYTLKGGRDRWDAFYEAVCDFGGFAVVAVEAAQEALHTSDVGFSEFTDPAFAGLVERDEQ